MAYHSYMCNCGRSYERNDTSHSGFCSEFCQQLHRAQFVFEDLWFKLHGKGRSLKDKKVVSVTSSVVEFGVMWSLKFLTTTAVLEDGTMWRMYEPTDKWSALVLNRKNMGSWICDHEKSVERTSSPNRELKWFPV